MKNKLLSHIRIFFFENGLSDSIDKPKKLWKTLKYLQSVTKYLSLNLVFM